MKTRKIKMIKIERVNDVLSITIEKIKDDLHTFYEIINCTSIDIVKRSFNGVIFNIVCDDYGLIKANENNELPTSYWQDENGSEALCGTLLLCHCDEHGNLTDIDYGEIFNVLLAVRRIKNYKNEEFDLLYHDIY